MTTMVKSNPHPATGSLACYRCKRKFNDYEADLALFVTVDHHTFCHSCNNTILREEVIRLDNFAELRTS